MIRRVFIVHRWGGLATDNWYQWLSTELEKEGIEVHVPQMPQTDTPHIATWVPALATVVGTPDEQAYFVGHSVGCSTVLRYIESLSEGTKAGGAVFVAPWAKSLTNLEDDEETQTIAKEWLDTPIDFAKVRVRLPKSVAIFSDNDKFVPLDNQEVFRDKFNSKIIIEHGLGHMSPDDDVEQVPSILSSALSLLE